MTARAGLSTLERLRVLKMNHEQLTTLARVNTKFAHTIASLGYPDDSKKLLACQHNAEKGLISHCHSPLCIKCRQWRAFEEKRFVGSTLTSTQQPLLFAIMTTNLRSTADIRSIVQDDRIRWRAMLRQEHPHPKVRKPINEFTTGTYRWVEVACDCDDPALERVHHHVILAVTDSYSGYNHIGSNTWNSLWQSTAEGLPGSAQVKPVRDVAAVAGYIAASSRFEQESWLMLNEPSCYTERSLALRGLHRYQSTGTLIDRGGIAQTTATQDSAMPRWIN